MARLYINTADVTRSERTAVIMENLANKKFYISYAAAVYGTSHSCIIPTKLIQDDYENHSFSFRLAQF